MLRNLAVLLMVLIVAATAHAQPRSLFGSDEFEIGGFGGVGTHYTTFKGDPGFLVGGFGAFHVNKVIYLGIGGYGLTTRHDAPAFPSGEDAVWNMGYGGGLVGVIWKSDDILHLAGDVLIGGGGVGKGLKDYDYDEDDDEHRHLEDEFFMVQPMVHGVLNVTSWMRVTAGAGYRFVNGVDTRGLDNSDLSGPVAGLTFRWGRW
ncbi:hypothetical protein GF324_13140 [bacterium]|nr:hypothetical protein [bacterium]